jgi:chemotaxis protein CheD
MKARARKATQEDIEAGCVPRRYFNAQDNIWHVQITQGEMYITSEPNELITTVLGSCIAACIRDPAARVGGMNHFLLPDSSERDLATMRYGANAMELLINGLLKRGALRSRLEAKLFGGANVIAGLSMVGSRNAEFAEEYLQREGIRLMGGDLRGDMPRRIQFWPLTGRVRALTIGNAASVKVSEMELFSVAQAKRRDQRAGNDVELF